MSQSEKPQPTPRTDALYRLQPNGGFGLEKSQCIAQWYDFARQLEQELSSMTAARDYCLHTMNEAIEENTKLRHDLERATENHSADLSAVSATPPRATAKGLPDYPLELVPGCKWPACDCPGRWDCSATADRTASKEGK